MFVKKIIKAVFPGLYGWLVYSTVRLLQDTESGLRFWKRPLYITVVELLACFAIGYLDLYIVKKICVLYDKKRLTGKTGFSLLWQEPLLIVLLSTLAVNVIITPITAFTGDGLSVNDFVNINVIPALYVLIYYGVVRSRTFLKAYVAHQLLLEKITNDHLQTELKFLKAQYHPHFLFNAMNTIYFQMDEDVPAAQKSMDLLSSLLRYQLYDQQQQVAISEELNYLNEYIAFQQIRTGSQLNITVSFDKRLTGQQVYPLLLLPLVENAFKYSSAGHSIDISAGIHANTIRFSVVNGTFLRQNKEGTYQGIGLENLARRLALLYPGKHALHVRREADRFIAQLELTL